MREAFLLSFASGAFVLAVWVDARFRRLVPASMWRLAGHVIAAALVCTIGLGFAMPVFGPSEAGRMAAVFGVALPALTYGMLGGVWALRITRAAMGDSVR